MRLWFLCAIVAAVSAASGCGGPKLYPVKGKVLYNNKPMKGGGSISLVPTGNQSGKAAGGEIKEDGTFVLMTNKDGDGSMPGEFRVVIVQSTEREPGTTQDGEKAGKATAVVAAADRIPTVYADPVNTPLVMKVEEKDNDWTLELRPDVGGEQQRPPGAARLGDPLRDMFAKLKREPLRVRGE